MSLGDIAFDLNFLKDPMDYMRLFHHQKLLQVVSIDVFLVLTFQRPHYLVEEPSLRLIVSG